MARHHQILIVGGGSAGITVAASLKNHTHDGELDIAIIDPSSDHYYQPAFTLVGAGSYNLKDTRRDEASLIPDGVQWIQDSAASIDPDGKKVGLSKGRDVTYDFLVVCPGLVCNWDGIEGLAENIGSNGVCSNYSPEHVEYTWESIKAFPTGGTALFTQPAMPIKCPGAPQKIAYLMADYLRRGGVLQNCNVHFLPQGPSMFGVPFFARELAKIADDYGIHKHFHHNLTKIDGANKRATTKARQSRWTMTCSMRCPLKDRSMLLKIQPYRTTVAGSMCISIPCSRRSTRMYLASVMPAPHPTQKQQQRSANKRLWWCTTCSPSSRVAASTKATTAMAPAR